MSSETSTACADQSVEELRRELAEAREQRAATAEILAAIANASTDPYRVFAEIAASAARLCDAHNSAILQLAGHQLRLVGRHGPLPTMGPVGRGVLPLTRGFVQARAVIDRKTIHVADLQAETHEFPEGSDLARRLGHRTIVAVPLMRAGEAIGAIGIRRTEVRPFTDRQIELLKIFADQAVIAIENARLFEAERASKRELQETLEQQTATANVLRVISSAPRELQSVFDAMLANATRLCGAKFGILTLYDGDAFRSVALHNVPPAYAKTRLADPFRPHSKGAMARLARTRQTAQVEDVSTQPPYLEGNPEVVALVDLAGARTIVNVPMVKEQRLIGTISIFRQEVRAFTKKQIELIESFADQAVIAIENTRLFEAEQSAFAKRSLEYSSVTTTAHFGS
jgi:GAF domain-containing protein